MGVDATIVGLIYLAAGILQFTLPIALGVFASSVAKKKGRGQVRWFLAGMLIPVFGLSLIHVLPPVGRRNCHRCHASFKIGEEVCTACGIRLPDEYAIQHLVNDGSAYDGQCSSCGTPYRLADYRSDAATVFCSRCRAEIQLTSPAGHAQRQPWKKYEERA